MKRIVYVAMALMLLVAASGQSAYAQKKVTPSKTQYAREALAPYVESGELPGAISIFYKDGVQETCCIGYADVEAKRRIGLDNVYMQCSQTKGFCGVTIAKLVEEMDWEQRPYNDLHVFASAGAGLWTTAADQLKFYKMLMNLGLGDNGVRILKEETVKSILAVSTRPADMEGYSLGLTAPVKDTEDSWFGHGGAWATQCSVNWHKKELRMWVVQKAGGPEPWKNARAKAAETFFAQDFSNSTVDAYTGRTK